jgi:hypothetical protein
MAENISDLKTALGTDSLIFQLDPGWGSVATNNRQLIRESIAQHFSKHYPDTQIEVADLAKRPAVSDWSLSVSHAKELGGWLATPAPNRTGLDIESEARLTAAPVERISTPEEIKLAPNIKFLWCAKEAAFKALREKQPVVVSRMNIQSWTALSSTLWSFTGSYAKSAYQGVVFVDSGHVIAMAIASQNEK